MVKAGSQAKKKIKLMEFKHPKHSFILAKTLASGCLKLYTGDQIQELVVSGLLLDASATGLDACRLLLEDLA